MNLVEIPRFGIYIIGPLNMNAALAMCACGASVVLALVIVLTVKGLLSPSREGYQRYLNHLNVLLIPLVCVFLLNLLFSVLLMVAYLSS